MHQPHVSCPSDFSGKAGTGGGGGGHVHLRVLAITPPHAIKLYNCVMLFLLLHISNFILIVNKIGSRQNCLVGK